MLACSDGGGGSYYWWSSRGGNGVGGGAAGVCGESCGEINKKKQKKRAPLICP